MSKRFIINFYLLTMVALLMFNGCRSDDDPQKNDGSIGDSTNKVEGSDSNSEQPVETTIDKIKDGAIKEGTKVILREVIVTAVDGYGNYTGDVFVQEVKGGKWSGIKLYKNTRTDGKLDDLKPGDLVKVEGTVKYFTPSTPFDDKKHPNKKHIKEIVDTQISFLGKGTAPTPEVVMAKELISDPTAEAWEHVLVKVVDAKVTGIADAKYNNFPVSDSTGSGLDVDGDLFLHSPKVGDCLNVTGILIYWYRYRINPRAPEDVTNGTQCKATKVIEIMDIQDTTSPNHPKDNTDVKIVGVVTAVDSTPGSDGYFKGFWIQDEKGGPYSGIHVYYSWKKKAPPPVGNKVEITGMYTEYPSGEKETLSELYKVVSIVDKGEKVTIVPKVVKAEDICTGCPKAEQYEGVLVKVKGITVGDTLTNSGKKYGFKDSKSELYIENDIYDFMDKAQPEKTSKWTITGPLHFSFNNFKVFPRGAADMTEE